MLSQDKHRVTYQWSDTKVFCRFTFSGRRGVLLFGYRRMMADGPETDVATGRMLFDRLGNIRQSPDDATSLWNVTQPEVRAQERDCGQSEVVRNDGCGAGRREEQASGRTHDHGDDW